MPIMFGATWFFKQLKSKSKTKKSRVTYFCAAVVEKVVVLQMAVMFQVSGVIQFTFMCSVRIFVPNVKTDTVCIQVATVFTLVQVLDSHVFNPVIH